MSTATGYSEPLTPQLVSLRNRYAFARSSVSRFGSDFLVDYVVPRERARNREIHAAGDLGPGDLVYLRAVLDELEDRGLAHLVAVA